MDTYTHGHHQSVVSHHAARTVENSAGFLLPHLEPGMQLLDVGCGPGSITIELAEVVSPGRVIGIDIVDKVLRVGRQAAGEARIDNITFATEDVYELSFADNSFAVVYAHQVLQHLIDPVRALGEMRRVVADGGMVAVRDADYGGFFWTPTEARLTRWLELYHQVTEENGAEADAGRHISHWMRQAGFTDIQVTTSNWHYETRSERAWWADGWFRRSTESSFADQAIKYGLASQGELRDIANAWHWWRDQPDGFLLIPHVEAIGRA